MTVFKSFFLVARRMLVMTFVYIGIMALMSVMATSGTAKTDELTVSTKDYPLSVVNRDTGAPLAQALVDFLAERTQMKPIVDDEVAIREALLWREAGYVLVIPQGFSEAVKKGEAPKMPGYAGPDDYVHLYVDSYVNRFVGTVAAYHGQFPQWDDKMLVQSAVRDLSGSLPLVPARVAAETQKPNGMALYLRYVSYPLLAAISSTLGMILAAMFDRKIVLRSRMGRMSEIKRNVQITLAGWLFGTLVWVALVVVGIFTSRSNLGQLFDKSHLLMLAASYLYMLICVAIALLISAFTQNGNVITGVSNVVALGSSFLAGVFVPIELLGPGMVKVAHALPAYWYTVAVRAVGDVMSPDAAAMAAFKRGMLVMALMLAVILVASLLINKVKRQQGT